MKIIYEDENVKVFDKPSGLVSDDIAGRAHRLDKDTSGVLLAAKNDGALQFLQKEFKERRVEKEYIALIVGTIKQDEGRIETLLGRSPNDRRKQKVYFHGEPGARSLPTGRQEKRAAITEYRVLQRFADYTLVQASPKTGRKHQLRAHFAYTGHPVAADKLYGFKNQACPEGLERQFLHASKLRVKLPNGAAKEFQSELPADLSEVLEKLSEAKPH